MKFVNLEITTKFVPLGCSLGDTLSYTKTNPSEDVCLSDDIFALPVKL